VLRDFSEIYIICLILLYSYVLHFTAVYSVDVALLCTTRLPLFPSLSVRVRVFG